MSQSGRHSPFGVGVRKPPHPALRERVEGRKLKVETHVCAGSWRCLFFLYSLLSTFYRLAERPSSPALLLERGEGSCGTDGTGGQSIDRCPPATMGESPGRGLKFGRRKLPVGDLGWFCTRAAALGVSARKRLARPTGLGNGTNWASDCTEISTESSSPLH